ncbi:MAG: hypothetical protein RQ899_06890 [Pseudomonadales bacterium]|nr:hypothetical protein [Pseudomonadales bacterium]
MLSIRLIRLLIAAALALSMLSGLNTVQAAEHPDFSGTWTTWRGNGGAGAFAAPGGEIKLTAAAKAARQDYLSITEGTNYSPGNACVGYGMPASMLGSGGYPMEIIQHPEQIFVIYEAHNEIRRFYLGGEARDPHTFFPERNGYSTAHWEGERLIVETSRLKTQVDTRYPHSNAATIREEYYLDTPLSDGTRVLAADLTMSDPLWLEEPFVITKRWQEMSDYHVLSYECSEPKWLDEMESLYKAAGLNMIQE